MLSLAELDEVIALVDDLAGEADEEVLADALESLYQPVEYTEAVKDQMRLGLLAVFRLECEERLELRTLIAKHGHKTSPKMRTRLARILHEAKGRTHRAGTH